MSDLVICKHRKEYCRLWMSLLKPDVINQHKTQNSILPCKQIEQSIQYLRRYAQLHPLPTGSHWHHHTASWMEYSCLHFYTWSDPLHTDCWLWLSHVLQLKWKQVLLWVYCFVTFDTYTTHVLTFSKQAGALTLKVLIATIDAQWEGMGDVGSETYEPALLPPCPTIRVLNYSN